MPSCAFRPQRSAAPRAGHEGDAPERSFRIGARRSSGRSAPSASPRPDPKRAHSQNSPLPKTPYLPSPRTSSVRKSACLPTAQKSCLLTRPAGLPEEVSRRRDRSVRRVALVLTDGNFDGSRRQGLAFEERSSLVGRWGRRRSIGRVPTVQMRGERGRERERVYAVSRPSRPRCRPEAGVPLPAGRLR